MKQKKLKFTIASLLVHTAIAVFFAINRIFDPGWWVAWFGSFNTTIGVFAKFNHDDKKVYIENGVNR